jgi:hypothetical protein
MSQLGHSRRFGDVRVMSAFPLIATEPQTSRHVSKVPISEVSRRLGTFPERAIDSRDRRGRTSAVSIGCSKARSTHRYVLHKPLGIQSASGVVACFDES